MANTDLGVLVKNWGPIMALLTAVALGSGALAENQHQNSEIARLEMKIEKLENTQREDIKGIRDSLGLLQLQVAKICGSLPNCE